MSVSATPAVDPTSCNGTPGTYGAFKLGPLTATTSPTFANGSAGRKYTIQVYNGSTAQTLNWPAAIVGPCTIDPAVNSRTEVTGTMDAAGTSLLVEACSYLDQAATVIAGPTRTAPATPAASTVSCWFDSTNATIQCKDSSANIFSAVKTASSGTSHQWVDWVAGTGLVHTSQPAFTDVSGSATTAQLPTVTLRRVCTIDNDSQSATVLTAVQLSGHCYIPAASTIVEVSLIGGTGTLTGTAANPTVSGASSIQLGKYTPNGGSSSNALLSGLLAMASGKVCAMTSTSGTCIDGTTSSGTITISTTALAAGDMLYVSAATADAAQTWVRIAITYTVN